VLLVSQLSSQVLDNCDREAVSGGELPNRLNSIFSSRYHIERDHILAVNLSKMMNFFRFAGDMCHVLSILVLLLRLRVTKNANGISVKTQELYLIVFVARYLDLFTTFYSVYNSVMKVLYITSTAYIIYMVKGTEPFKTTYESAQDSFLHLQFAVAPALVLGFITNFIQGFNIMEVRLA
jgi:hypothetical protein